MFPLQTSLGSTKFPLPCQLVCPDFGDFPPLLSFLPSAFAVSPSAWALTLHGSGAFPWVRVRPARGNALFWVEKLGAGWRKSSSLFNLPQENVLTLISQSPAQMSPSLRPEFLSPWLNSLALALRAKLPGNSAFPLQHGVCSYPLGLQRTHVSSSITWELARVPHPLRSYTRSTEDRAQQCVFYKPSPSPHPPQ